MSGDPILSLGMVALMAVVSRSPAAAEGQLAHLRYLGQKWAEMAKIMVPSPCLGPPIRIVLPDTSLT